MSGITQSAVAVGQRVVGVDRRARIIALGAVSALSAILIVLVLALGGSFSGTDANEAAAPATQQPATASPEPGVRYDGGPEEGTRGAASPLVSREPSVDDPVGSVGAAGSRYDGGPEEGTRGPNR
jgi:hypothetical protein